MATLGLTDPVNGTTADADLIASNNHAIETVLNGGLDNSNIAASAGISVSKLAAGSNGQVLTTIGGVPVWGSAAAGETTYRKTTAKAVNTTTSATDLLNGEITVVAGAMGSTGVLRLAAWGDFLNDSGGATAPPRLQLVFGGTTFLDTGTMSANVGFGSARYGWKLEAIIANSASNAQSCSIDFGISFINGSLTASAFTTGEGNYSPVGPSPSYGGRAIGSNSGLTIDTTASKTLVLNVINGSSSASYETKLFGALVEII